MKLAARYASEEAALAAELKGAYGEGVDVKAFQAAPRTPIQIVADKQREVEARAGEYAAARSAAAGEGAYSAHAVQALQVCCLAVCGDARGRDVGSRRVRAKGCICICSVVGDEALRPWARVLTSSPPLGLGL